MSPEVARRILRLGFDDEQKARMHELAQKNQEGQILPDELQELDRFIKSGDLLAILHSKARKSLKEATDDGSPP